MSVSFFVSFYVASVSVLLECCHLASFWFSCAFLVAVERVGIQYGQYSIIQELHVLLFVINGINISSQQPRVTLLFPTAGRVLNFFCYQDTVNVTWISHFAKPLLYTFCLDSTADIFIQGMYSFPSSPSQKHEQDSEFANTSRRRTRKLHLMMAFNPSSSSRCEEMYRDSI